jgi:hypothetical protein
VILAIPLVASTATVTCVSGALNLACSQANITICKVIGSGKRLFPNFKRIPGTGRQVMKRHGGGVDLV